MDKDKFYEYLKEEEKSVLEEQQAALDIIAKELDLPKVKEPYEYIKQLQSWFDMSKIEFTDEYYEVTGKDKADGSETVVQGFNFATVEIKATKDDEN